jgi:hypothetical protein
MNTEDIQQLVRGRIEQAGESLADAKTLLDTGRSGRSVVNRSLGGRRTKRTYPDS